MPKTELKRDILLELQNNPNATNKQIANAVDCSPSYVSTVRNQYDNYSDVDALQDQIQKDLDNLR